MTANALVDNYDYIPFKHSPMQKIKILVVKLHSILVPSVTNCDNANVTAIVITAVTFSATKFLKYNNKIDDTIVTFNIVDRYPRSNSNSI